MKRTQCWTRFMRHGVPLSLRALMPCFAQLLRVLRFTPYSHSSCAYGVPLHYTDCLNPGVRDFCLLAMPHISKAFYFNPRLSTHLLTVLWDASPSKRLPFFHVGFPLHSFCKSEDAVLIPLPPEVQNGITVLPLKS